MLGSLALVAWLASRLVPRLVVMAGHGPPVLPVLWLATAAAAAKARHD